MITQYLLTPTGQTAQDTATNRQKLANTKTTVLSNGSDNLLLTVLDQIMGCASTQFMAQDLADPFTKTMVPSLALNELQAAQFQAAPIALVPSNDDMVVVNGQPNIGKMRLYRVGVNQDVTAPSDTLTYCQNLATIAPPRFALNEKLWSQNPPLVAAMGNNMFTFMANRYVQTFGPGGLNCTGLGLTPPISVTLNNGVAVSATINLNANPNIVGNNNNNNVVIGGVTGAVGGSLLLAGSFIVYRRRRHSGTKRSVKLEASNPGYGYNNGGFAASFNNFRQSMMQPRQSMMNFFGWNGNTNSPAGGYSSNTAATSPMNSGNNRPQYGQQPFGQQQQYSQPSYGQQQQQYGQPSYGQQQQQYGQPPFGQSQQFGGGGYGAYPPPQPYAAGGYGRGY